MVGNSTPIYVKVGLFGIGSRKSAMMYFWLSIIIALGSSLYFQTLLGLVLLLAALWYWAAVKWMDANDGWQTK